MKYILFFLFLFSANNVMACTHEEAENKRLILSKISKSYFAGKEDHEISLEDRRFSVEVAMAESQTTSGNYEDICQAYDNIAEKYNIDFKEHANSTLTIKDYEKWGEKNNGCGLGELHVAAMDMYNKIHKKVLSNELEFRDLEEYMKDMSKNSKYAYSDLAMHCKMMKMMEKKYREKYPN